MDPEVVSLTQGAGATLVALMATDAWQATREGISRLWRRVQPGRADILVAELEADREEVLAARTADDQETLSELRAQWQGRFRRLLAAHPDLAVELRELFDELAPLGGEAVPVITQRATASGQARVYQAGRDQHITER
ncbi:hypothetical protein ACFO3J_31465 [Streptomyces polygonati]|uniref:Uncharacterized protein n=1 Tax=Streptomyces polygonati TaxID=1617087 RepID=A0ABV8HYC6_9ACTN